MAKLPRLGTGTGRRLSVPATPVEEEIVEIDDVEEIVETPKKVAVKKPVKKVAVKKPVTLEKDNDEGKYSSLTRKKVKKEKAPSTSKYNTKDEILNTMQELAGGEITLVQADQMFNLVSNALEKVIVEGVSKGKTLTRFLFGRTLKVSLRPERITIGKKLKLKGRKPLDSDFHTSEYYAVSFSAPISEKTTIKGKFNEKTGEFTAE